jgi:ferrochelatase
MSAKGLLLVNLGTPEGTPGQGPTTAQVRTYLREFLMDPYVVDISPIGRWLLVNAIILPRRPAQSAALYRKVWTPRGSPLLVYHLDLAREIQASLGDRWKVEPAMRYGNPSIGAGLQRLHEAGVRETLVVPLYPQYSLAATASSIEACRTQVARHAPGMQLRFLPPFYGSSRFLDPFAEVARETLTGFDYEHLLFSFHGLPERQVRKTDRAGNHCFATAGCCDRITDANRDCYRAQSFATAREIALRLGVPAERYTVCFQSRLGRTPWIKPYTDVVYEELAARGIRRIAVMSPAFVADCLETLEEIAIRGREQFRALGGEELKLIPSLNARPSWVAGLSELITEEVRK